MNWHYYIALLSAVALSLPLVLIVVLRLYTNKSFLALGIHYLLAFVYNLMTSGILDASVPWRRNLAISNNFLDVPLILIFLLYFTRSWRLSKQLLTALGAYIIFEIITVVITGYNITATTIILGPGILIILSFCFFFFLKHIQVHHDHPQEPGKIVMLSTLLFSYGSYSLIYVFHYVLEMPYVNDVFLVYYLVTTFASVAMAIGIWIERKSITQSEVEAITGNSKNQTGEKKGVAKVIPLDENEFRYK